MVPERLHTTTEEEKAIYDAAVWKHICDVQKLEIYYTADPRAEEPCPWPNEGILHSINDREYAF